MSTLKNDEQNEKEIRKFKIYAHVNKVNGKVYIGQTCKLPKQRWDNGKGYSYNSHFWNAIQKYGWDNFEHIILFEVDTQELANISEEFLIKKYKTNNSNYGYNILPGGSNVCGENNPNYGNKYSEETKKKMSEISKKRLSNKENHPMYGKHLSDETREKIRIGNKKRKITQTQIKKKCELDPTVHSIYKLDEKMNILYKYTTKKELSDELGKNANMFFPKKPYCVYDNFIYIFTDFYDSKNGDRDFLDYVDRKFHNSNTGSKKVICLNDLKIYYSISQASKERNINPATIISCCQGTSGYAGIDSELGKLMWEYYDESKTYHKKEYSDYKKCFCITTNELFDSAFKASEKYNIAVQNIQLACRKYGNTLGGNTEYKKLQWCYFEENYIGGK